MTAVRLSNSPPWHLQALQQDGRWDAFEGSPASLILNSLCESKTVLFAGPEVPFICVVGGPFSLADSIAPLPSGVDGSPPRGKMRAAKCMQPSTWAPPGQPRL